MTQSQPTTLRQLVSSAIRIGYTGTAMFVAVQYEVLDLVFRHRGEEWEVHRQRLHREGGRIYDVMQIKIGAVDMERFVYRYENFYFDITDCLEKDLLEEDYHF